MSRRCKAEVAYYERELSLISNMLVNAGILGVRSGTYYRVPINKKNEQIIKTLQLLHGQWEIKYWTRFILIHVKPWVDPNKVYPMPF